MEDCYKMTNIPKEVPTRTSFHQSWNSILRLLNEMQVKDSSDVIVKRTKNGISLELAPGARAKRTLNYDYLDVYSPREGEDNADVDSRVSTYITSYATDCPAWNANTAQQAYRVGDIVRVLPYPINDISEEIQPSQVDPLSGFPNVNWSGSKVWGTDMIWQGNLVPIPGVYICVADIPASGSLTYTSASSSGAPYLSRNPAIFYGPCWPEPKVNAQYFGTTVVSGSKFEDYQGRYWECLSIYANSTTGNAGMVFKGTWSTSTLYTVQDVVRLESTGSNGGTYVCVVSLTGSATGSSYAPEVGSPYWVQLSTSDTKGSWN